MRLKDYPRVTTLSPDNVFIIDGPDGAKSILASDLGFEGDGDGGNLFGIHPVPFTINSTVWQASTTFPDFPFQATLAITGVTAGDLVRADFDLASLIAASDAGIAPAGASAANAVIFYAQANPGVNLSGMYTIFKGGA